MNNGISLIKIVSGLSKTLNIANQFIPLYKRIKPMISNSGKILSNIQKLNIKNNDNKNSSQQQVNNTTNEKIINSSLPTFFQ